MLLHTILMATFSFQPVQPINANVKIELGGTQCNLLISRLEPRLSLLFQEKRTLVLQEELFTREKLKAADMKTMMWACTFSAPEMTVMLCGIDDLPLYHVSISNLPLIFILHILVILLPFIAVFINKCFWSDGRFTPLTLRYPIV